MKKIGNFFGSIWRWFKDTAWIQIILLVSVVVGVVLCINPVVNGIKSLIQSHQTVTFYKDHNITYTEYEQYVSEQKAGQENQFIVLFYDDDCSHCERIQKSVRSFYKENSEQVIYTINLGDEDAITDAGKSILAEDFAPVYNNSAEEEKNEQYQYYPTDELIVTPTFVVVRDNAPLKVILGVDETKDGVYEALYKMLDIND